MSEPTPVDNIASVAVAAKEDNIEPASSSASSESESTSTTAKTSTPITTPAGSQINSDWEHLKLGIDCFFAFLANLGEDKWDQRRDYHVMFRCGTVARFNAFAEEFVGYTDENHEFPAPVEKISDRLAVDNIKSDNRRVWKTQKKIPGEVGLAIRRAYHEMIMQGYPYPGENATRKIFPTGLGVKAPTPLSMAMVTWPGLDRLNRVFNLAFYSPGDPQLAAMQKAATEGGNLRRYDFMFPEVAAVYMPPTKTTSLKVWAYNDKNEFVEHSVQQ
jgi:hypothetical protein